MLLKQLTASAKSGLDCKRVLIFSWSGPGASVNNWPTSRWKNCSTSFLVQRFNRSCSFRLQHAYALKFFNNPTTSENGSLSKLSKIRRRNKPRTLCLAIPVPPFPALINRVVSLIVFINAPTPSLNKASTASWKPCINSGAVWDWIKCKNWYKTLTAISFSHSFD